MEQNHELLPDEVAAMKADTAKLRLEAVIVGLVLLLLILGGVLWYMATHPAPHDFSNPFPVGTTTQTGGNTSPESPQTLNETAAYYEIQATYPSSTGLKATAGAVADQKAVTAMKGFEQNTIDAFKEQGNFAHLSHDDIQMMGLDQRKENLTITYTVKRSPHTISYIYLISQDTLGAHPNAYYRTFTFDTKTGVGLTISDVFKSGANYDQILSDASRKALPPIIAQHENVSVDDVDLGSIKSGTLAEDDSFQNWYIDGTALVLIFPPYQVAPYSAGEIEVRLPLSSLSSNLNPAYK